MLGGNRFQVTLFIKKQQGCRGEQVFQPVERSSTVQEKVNHDVSEIDQGPEMSLFRPERLSLPGKLTVELLEYGISVPFVLDVPEDKKVRIGTGLSRHKDPDGVCFLFLKEPGHPFRPVSGFGVRFPLGNRFPLQKELPGWSVEIAGLRDRSVSGMTKIHITLSQRYRI